MDVSFLPLVIALLAYVGLLLLINRLVPATDLLYWLHAAAICLITGVELNHFPQAQCSWEMMAFVAELMINHHAQISS
ncbi:hypothetical protein P0D73_27340 [Paraburkholderia sp. RL18-101-BIB-B]|uniref:hypothetical protein n=1 Tax=unclassified Paraburkholderia TaxID=2615204 RepID=UPI0038B9A488